MIQEKDELKHYIISRLKLKKGSQWPLAVFPILIIQLVNTESNQILNEVEWPPPKPVIELFNQFSPFFSSSKGGAFDSGLPKFAGSFSGKKNKMTSGIKT